MDRNIERAVQRARKYWYEDGLTEIATGCVFVGIGMLFLAEAFRVIPSGASSIGLIVLVIGGGWLARRIVAHAKARLTYPRTGFVSYRRQKGRRSRAVTATVGAVMAILVSLLFATSPVSLSWIPAVDGLAIGVFTLYLGHSLGLVRFYVLSAASAVIGCGISLSAAGDVLGSGIYFGLMGLAILASGATALTGYLRRTGRSEAE